MASILSVLAKTPVARAKSRTWRGLTMTTGRRFACSSAAKGISYLPVASRIDLTPKNESSFHVRLANKKKGG